MAISIPFLHTFRLRMLPEAFFQSKAWATLLGEVSSFAIDLATGMMLSICLANIYSGCGDEA
jgi:hypothetical protein